RRFHLICPPALFFSLSLFFLLLLLSHIFFFNPPATPWIYPLSLHDALPICRGPVPAESAAWSCPCSSGSTGSLPTASPSAGKRSDRKSTRLNSSHQIISYAVFCLKKKKATATTYSSTVSTT